MIENLMLDLHLQYALHTTSFEEQPLSDKTLSRFRKRCYDYETLHNEDLYHDCVKNLSGTIAKIMGINGRIRRMDSMMIESNIRKLSRMELLYTCISKMVIFINKFDAEAIPEKLKHYADPNDSNQVIYHQRSTETDDRMQIHFFLSAVRTMKRPQNTNCLSAVFLNRPLLRTKNAGFVPKTTEP